MEKCACTCKSCNIMLAFLLPNTKVYVTLETRLFCHDIFCVSGTSTTVAPARKRRATRGAASSRPKRVRGGRGRGQTRPAALATTPARGVGRGRGLTRPAAASTTPAGRVGRGRGQTRQRQQRRLGLQNSASRTSLIGARGCPYSARSKDTQGKTTWPTRSPQVPGIIHHVPSLLHCYRMDAWAIRRPWLTFVNALANSILGRFYTARTQKICFVRLAYGIAKAGD